MKPEISVIIPVYKTEQYLNECVDSVLNQTFQNFEIILVNDGSPDDSGLICDAYKQKDNRIKVFHKKNGGQSSARNLALSYVIGTYVFFLDSDDVLHPNAFKILLDKMDLYHVDIIAYSFDYIDEKSNPINCFIKSDYDHDVIHTGADFLNRFTIIGAMCMYFYRTDFLLKKQLKMLEGIYREDEDFVVRAISFCECIVSISDKIYKYRKNLNSTTNKKDLEHKLKLIEDTCHIAISLQKLMNQSDNILIRRGIRKKIESLGVNVYGELVKYGKSISPITRKKIQSLLIEADLLPFRIRANGMKYKVYSIIVRLYLKLLYV